VKKIAFVAALLVAAVQAVPATAATFLFIRHAQSATNAGISTTVQDIVDPPLTALGQQQAIDLSHVLASDNVIAIYTSAYQRTQETAAPTAAEFGLTPTVLPATNEWYFGDATSLAQLGGANLQGVMNAWAAGNPNAKPNLPNSESLNDLAARVVPAWQDIVNTYADQSGVVLIFGHSDETGDVMPYFAKNITPAFAFANPLNNTGIIQLELLNGQPYVTNWQGIAVPTPEPATWAMLLVGFGAIGAAMRRSHAAGSRRPSLAGLAA
jgi:probable phosphoglycerate mutase